jgi:hypothetical protein
MRKIISPGHATLAALFLGSAITVVACAPAPMDAGDPNPARASGGSSGSSNSGGSSGSASGGSSGSNNSGGSSGSASGGSSGSSGGSSGSASGGSSGSNSGGSSGSRGGSSGSSSGGSSGSSGGSSGSATGGSSGSTGGSSGGSPDAGGPAGATFTQVYDMVIKPTCALPACHGAAAGKGGLKYADKAMAYMTLKAKAGIIKAGDPAGSKLITEITPKGGMAPMPPKMTPLTADKIAMVTAWVMAGANDD